MGPLGVVGLKARVDDRARLFERIEEVRVEHLVAVRPVKTLDEGILIRFTRVNVAEAHPPGRAPLHERRGEEFRTVVPAES
jgi:hypothetical protein